MTKKLSKIQLLAVISTVLVTIALILSVTSSNTAYSLSHINTIIIMCVSAILLNIIFVAMEKKLPSYIKDLIMLISMALTSGALCAMISGRILLMVE